MENSTLTQDHQEHTDGMRNHIPSTAEITTVSEAMKQLGDPSRLQIFWLLCHCEECVLNIASLVNMSSPAVSHHLRLLKNSKLITGRRHGKEMYYKAVDSELVETLHHTIEKLAKITCPKD